MRPVKLYYIKRNSLVGILFIGGGLGGEEGIDPLYIGKSKRPKFVLVCNSEGLFTISNDRAVMFFFLRGSNFKISVIFF